MYKRTLIYWGKIVGVHESWICENILSEYVFVNFARGLVSRSLLYSRSCVVTQRWIVVCAWEVIVCWVELHYVNVFFFHYYWLVRGSARYWVKTHPPKQSHSAVRVNTDQDSRATPRSSNRLDVTIWQGVWNIVHFEKSPLLCILL